MEENPANPANTGKAAWLGLVKEDYIWYSLDTNGQKISLDFTNFGNKPDTFRKTDCSYANKNGKWNLILIQCK